MIVNNFSQAVIDAAKNEREVRFTTYGRQTGKPSDVTIFVVTDGTRMFILSGQGMSRHWPQNLAAGGKGVVHLGGQDVSIRSSWCPSFTEANTGPDSVRRNRATRPGSGTRPLSS
jgi:hypothetical protein